jgi:hypothetical protein
MKCGLGMCGRCNIGPVYVCKDGPDERQQTPRISVAEWLQTGRRQLTASRKGDGPRRLKFSRRGPCGASGSRAQGGRAPGQVGRRLGGGAPYFSQVPTAGGAAVVAVVWLDGILRPQYGARVASALRKILPAAAGRGGRGEPQGGVARRPPRRMRARPRPDPDEQDLLWHRAPPSSRACRNRHGSSHHITPL